MKLSAAIRSRSFCESPTWLPSPSRRSIIGLGDSKTLHDGNVLLRCPLTNDTKLPVLEQHMMDEDIVGCAIALLEYARSEKPVLLADVQYWLGMLQNVEMERAVRRGNVTMESNSLSEDGSDTSSDVESQRQMVWGDVVRMESFMKSGFVPESALAVRREQEFSSLHTNQGGYYVDSGDVPCSYLSPHNYTHVLSSPQDEQYKRILDALRLDHCYDGSTNNHRSNYSRRSNLHHGDGYQETGRAYGDMVMNEYGDNFRYPAAAQSTPSQIGEVPFIPPPLNRRTPRGRRPHHTAPHLVNSNYSYQSNIGDIPDIDFTPLVSVSASVLDRPVIRRRRGRRRELPNVGSSYSTHDLMDPLEAGLVGEQPQPLLTGRGRGSRGGRGGMRGRRAQLAALLAGRELHSCNKCKKAFIKRHYLVRHQRRMHPDRLGGGGGRRRGRGGRGGAVAWGGGELEGGLEGEEGEEEEGLVDYNMIENTRRVNTAESGMLISKRTSIKDYLKNGSMANTDTSRTGQINSDAGGNILGFLAAGSLADDLINHVISSAYGVADGNINSIYNRVIHGEAGVFQGEVSRQSFNSLSTSVQSQLNSALYGRALELRDGVTGSISASADENISNVSDHINSLQNIGHADLINTDTYVENFTSGGVGNAGLGRYYTENEEDDSGDANSAGNVEGFPSSDIGDVMEEIVSSETTEIVAEEMLTATGVMEEGLNRAEEGMVMEEIQEVEQDFSYEEQEHEMNMESAVEEEVIGNSNIEELSVKDFDIRTSSRGAALQVKNISLLSYKPSGSVPKYSLSIGRKNEKEAVINSRDVKTTRTTNALTAGLVSSESVTSSHIAPDISNSNMNVVHTVNSASSVVVTGDVIANTVSVITPQSAADMIANSVSSCNVDNSIVTDIQSYSNMSIVDENNYTVDVTAADGLVDTSGAECSSASQLIDDSLNVNNLTEYITASSELVTNTIETYSSNYADTNASSSISFSHFGISSEDVTDSENQNMGGGKLAVNQGVVGGVIEADRPIRFEEADSDSQSESGDGLQICLDEVSESDERLMD